MSKLECPSSNNNLILFKASSISPSAANLKMLFISSIEGASQICKTNYSLIYPPLLAEYFYLLKHNDKLVNY